MNNHFVVCDLRRNLNNKHIYIIQGICSDGKKLGKIEAKGSKGYLPVKIETIDGWKVKNKYAKFPFKVNTEYTIHVQVPIEQDVMEAFKLYEDDELFYTVSKKQIRIMQKHQYWFLDGVKDKGGKSVISGWVYSKDTIKVEVLDKNGKLDAEVSYGYRRDVVEAYPEANFDYLFGFEVTVETNCNRLFINLITKKGKITKAVDAHPSKIKKEMNKIAKWEEKGVAYFRRHGFRPTVIRVKEKVMFRGEATNYKSWWKIKEPKEKDLATQRNQTFFKMPKISIVIPLYKTPEKYLKELVKSIRKQTYPNWELCLSDGSGKDSPIKELLKKYQEMDDRIKIVYNGKPLQISENTNEAIKIATGDFISFADHDDLLPANTLFECVKAINKHDDIDMIYTDEDKISMEGNEHFQPHFKPDFNVDLLNTTNYFCHFVMVDKRLIEKVGMLNPDFDGAQDYDFVLRCSEKAKRIHHIPKILYHWRAHKDSTAENPESKMYAFEAGARAIKAHYDRVGIRAEVSQTQCLGVYRSKYILDSEPLVSVIIPNKDHTDDLDKCIKSIKERSTYNNIEYVIVENNSTSEDTFNYYERLKAENNKVSVVTWEKEFNYSAINNFGVEHAKGEFLLFLNNDTEMINETCIEEMLGVCMREDVGIVGARLYYDDNTIQHAGVIVGMGGIAGHLFIGTPRDQVGYFARVISMQDYSAVTAACMMVKRSVFEKVGGFDPELKVAFNDVDFCLRVRKTGKLVVYNPYAELYHYESKSRGFDNTETKARRFNNETAIFEARWKQYLAYGDPYFNRNLSLDKNDCSLRKVK